MSKQYLNLHYFDFKIQINRLTFYSVKDYALSYEAVHTLTHQATA